MHLVVYFQQEMNANV